MMEGKRSDSPEPSCVSMKSDRSMDRPILFRDRDSSTDVRSQKKKSNISKNQLDSIFQGLEHKVITLIKNELKRFRKLLSPDYPACTERGVEDEEDLHSVREGALKITLHVLKNMNHTDLANTLHNKLASVYQPKLKSKLREKFKRIIEGISQHGSSALLNEIYTELYITEGWSGDVNNEHEVRQIETVSRRPATQETAIKCNDLFKDKSIRSVLTKGVAGIGKTVSVQKFILDWTEGKANQDVFFMFPLPFRELNLMKQQNLSLMNLLHHFFPEMRKLESIDCDSYKVVLIFDGLDECRLPLNFQKNERLCDVTESASVDVLLTNLIKGFTRDELLDIRQNTPHNILPVFNYSDVLLDIVVGGAVALFKHFKKRKRGKRAGALVKLRQRGFRTVLPSIHLDNIRSLPNKMDELLLLSRTNKDFSNSAALCFTESWLNDAIPDSALNLPGFQLFRPDRVAESAGKSRGGGTCFYINVRTYLTFNNDKPWFTAKLRHLRQAKEDAFRNGDRVLYNQARNTLNKEIRVAKRSYAKKLENQFSSNDPASVWKGLKDITNYKTPSPSTEDNQQLAEDLNEFYCRFETAGLTPHAPSEHLSTQPLTPLATPLSPPPALRISEDDVRQIFLKQKRRKAPGPDGVTPAFLKTCADQLAFIFSQIFNRSLELCEVPACFKRSTIIPIPKKPKITGLNDYRPVALTSVVMKSFERLVLAYLKNITGPLLDPLQFAYRANRSVDDAVNMGLHFILQHLDKSGAYVRLLFVDFSSAFNTIIPTLLQPKLTQLSVPSSICQWITSFLTDRHQLVKLGKFTSYSRTTSTGAPQGCILSPLLFSLYINDCTSTDPSVKLLKFVDDTTVIGLIQDGDESAYRQEIEQLAAWCSLNNLELNTLKTVEMIVDFRRNTLALPPLTIMNSTVPTVESFRFLGTTISQDLKWDTHIDAIIKKAQQRLYFLQQLRKFNLPQELLTQFYSAVIESVLCTYITVWFGSATKSGIRRLQRTLFLILILESASLCSPLDNLSTWSSQSDPS
ncbi:hypothetical protein QTP70_021027 [Hemibagrus guttatus]|uniref:Reverse transcriptase domain-containing protein n=1 Tax=Hemibagrus guttatus TaxID=175788 RepID=A0AAE0UGZ6_9TELE|nr:hypothetical protein QTP70_021027 [Hemibagrus guttatus]